MLRIEEYVNLVKIFFNKLFFSIIIEKNPSKLTWHNTGKKIIRD